MNDLKPVRYVPESYLELTGVLFFVTALLKFVLFTAGWVELQVTLVSWALLSTILIARRQTQRTECWFVLAIVLWFLETVFVVATRSRTPTLYDTPGFLREALFIHHAGGLDGHFGLLFSGDYPFFNRNPLIPYLASLVRVPGLTWFVTAKTLAVAGWVMAGIGIHHFARRWFNPRVALVGLALNLGLFPILQHQVGWVGADLAVLGFCLLALGGVRNHTVIDLITSGFLLALAYWTKANALFLVPFVILVVHLESKTFRQSIKKNTLMLGTWMVSVSPLLVNNWLNHGHPFYNMNQRYLLVPRDYAGDVSDIPGALPMVSSLTGKFLYVLDGFTACFQGFWYLLDLPGPAAVGFVGVVLLGSYLALRRDILNVIPLLYALATFFAQGLNYYVSPRFMFFGWTILVVYGGYALVTLLEAPLSALLSGRLARWRNEFSRRPVAIATRAIPPTLVLVVGLGLTVYYPRTGGIEDFLSSVEEPPHWSKLTGYLENRSVTKATAIADGPSTVYALEYTGYYNTHDLPEVWRWEDLRSWIDRKRIRWLLVDRESIGRRQILRKIGFSTVNGTVHVNRRSLPETLKLILEVESAVLLHTRIGLRN